MTDFMNNDRFLIGANYWESKSSINMWSNFDPAVIDSDFDKLSSHGIKTLRMFLVWPVFQPLKAIWANSVLYELRMDDESPLPDTDAGRAGVSESACENFAQLCRIADKYGIKLIVGLITGHMSYRHYAPPAFENRNFLTDPLLVKWETRFVRYFVSRFRNENAIAAWDLGNECANYGGCSSDQAYVWMTCIAAAIRESDPTRPIVSGFAGMPFDREPFNIRDTGELMDVLTTHPYQIFSATSIDPIDSMRPIIDPALRSTLYEDIGGKPCFIEETGSIGYTNCSENTEAVFLRGMLWSSYAEGCRGNFWWCAFDQGQLGYAPYDWNNYGSDYGFFRADGSEKPIAAAAKEFDGFLRGFKYAALPRRSVQAVCIVPRETNSSLKIFDSAFILAKQANLNLKFAHAEEKLPDSKLYIMPSVTSAKPIFLRRLNELLEKVREGASFYFSLGSTLFRRLPELTGLTVASRELIRGDTVTMDGESFHTGECFKLNIESVADTCEVLASGSDGRPVFVKNKYGKGYIYFLAFTLESMLGDLPGAFGEDSKPYYRFYEKFAAEAASDRAAASKTRQVLLTEHEIDENRRIIIGVNYSGRETEAEIELKNGWRITKRHHGGERLAAGEAFVIEAER